jgi:hypothetical protein
MGDKRTHRLHRTAHSKEARRGFHLIPALLDGQGRSHIPADVLTKGGKGIGLRGFDIS